MLKFDFQVFYERNSPPLIFYPHSGMDLCSCGWIDEGFAMYPIQYSRSGCVDRVSIKGHSLDFMSYKQPGLYWGMPSILSLMGVEPTHR